MVKIRDMIRSNYSIRNYFDIIGSIANIGRHLRYHTAAFNPERTELHQQIIDSAMPKTDSVPKERPKAHIVIGGAGSGKSRVVDQLKQDTERDFVCIDSDVLKQNLAEHEHAQNQAISKNHWLGVLQREAVFLRQEMLYQAVGARRDIVFESVGSDQSSIQDNIDELVAAGYEVALHLVDTSEAVSIDRVDERNKQSERQVPLSYAKKSNRGAKCTYQELATKNHGKIASHRWSNDGDTPQLDDHREINQCFNELINGLDEKRTEILNTLTPRDLNQQHIKAHVENLQKLRSQSPEQRNSHEMLMALITDIAIFPELYSCHEVELRTLYRLIDKNDFHVYYTSIQMNGPMKSHGGVMIGSPTLEKGISMAAAGDPRRGQIKLTKDFKQKLIQHLETLDSFPPGTPEQIGSKDEALEILRSASSFDSYGLQLLLTHGAPHFLAEYTDTIQFNPKLSLGFELWDKPRSSLQNRDTGLFNKQFPTYLKEVAGSWMKRGLGHLYHGVTRSVAIREQSHVASSTVLQRWIKLAEHQRKLDERRGLKYDKASAFWRFDSSATAEQGGNCNTISTHLLGANAETASLFNIGSAKGSQIEIPIARPERNAQEPREPRSGNKYSDMLWESHLAKLIVTHPQPYQNAVLRVNERIIKQLPQLEGKEKELLAIEIKKKFIEFDPLSDDPIKFLKERLQSTDPKDLYRGLLFHKAYFENLISKSPRESARDRYEYFKMRPSAMFGGDARGSKRERPPLFSHSGVGGMRLLDVGDLNLHEDSFNVDYHETPASSTTTFLDAYLRLGREMHGRPATFREQVTQEDAVFYSGASGTVTTTLPYIFSNILVDDPVAQENYIMALAGASSYAGHHSMYEIVAPLKNMRSNCPERFRVLEGKGQNLYQAVFTERFKRLIHHESGGAHSLYEQCVSNFESDHQQMERHLQTSKSGTPGVHPEDDRENPKKELIQLLAKKLHHLYKDGKSKKYIFLLDIKEKLERLDLNNPSGVEDLLQNLKQASKYDINLFQGPTGFSRFKSESGKSITESQWIVDRVQRFLNLVKESPSVALDARNAEQAAVEDRSLNMSKTHDYRAAVDSARKAQDQEGVDNNEGFSDRA